MIGSSDIQERHLARRALVDEFRSLFEGVVLHVNRVVTLHMKPDALGCRVVYASGHDGVQGIQVEAATGTTGFIGSAILAGIVRPVRSGLGKKGGANEPPWHPCSLGDLFKRIQINHSPNGDWQAVAHDSMQMADVIARAEHALRPG